MSAITKAVLLAAGRGTRMGELTNSIPKPMIVVRSKPILQHIIEGLHGAGVGEFLVVVGYRADVVTGYFNDGSNVGASISYVTQLTQDGTGRVVELAHEFVGKEPFILHYGDILVDPENYTKTVNLPADVEAIVTVKGNEDCSKGGAVFVDEEMRVTDLREKLAASEHSSPWYNAGIYTFRPSILEWTAKLQPSPRGEFELTDAVRGLAQSGKHVQAIELQGEWADVRDPGIVAQLNAL
jgi:UDP-N-acetylglucosamine diphosphorylase / glucose-1-phosphate thymidylyltransferase / UDP-N-acetylgalactosamine diphosphorylase / glucosamine-1-phosphate N-acetyltransferase / galactosamine-1-phosphate N-acetyltransferase